MGTLKQGISSLAFQAAGLPGPLGKMTTSLLSFAGGSALVLGVVAGLGLISAAFNKIGEAAENAEKLSRDAAEAFTKHLGAIRGTGEDQRFGLVTRLRELRTELERLQTERVLQGFTIFDKTRAMVRTEQEIGELVAALGRLDAKAAESQLADHFREVDAAVRAVANSFGTLLNPLADAWFQKVEEGPPIPPQWLDRKQFSKSLDQDAINKKIREMLGNQDMLDDLTQLGVSAGRQFVLGLIEGIESLEDLLKRVVMTVLDFFITKGITSILSGGSAFVANATSAPAAAMSPYTEPLGLQLSMTNYPPPRTPFDMARDVEVQRWLRETLLVARSQGFQ